MSLQIWFRTCAVRPDDDELVLVAIYRNDKLIGYELCKLVNGEWLADEGPYSWSVVSEGLMWAYFASAPDVYPRIKQEAA